MKKVFNIIIKHMLEIFLVFHIPYINNKLKQIQNQQYIEIKGLDYDNFASEIIPPEESLTRHNHIFNPLSNLILVCLS